MMRLLAIILALLAFPYQVSAQEVVTGLSQDAIELTPSFKGQNLFLYGAIKNLTPDPEGQYDVVVTISGEERSHIVLKKERVFGFWVNANSRTIRNVPEFYGLASTRPLNAITDASTLQRLGLGLDQLEFVKALKEDGADALGYAEGLVQVKEGMQLYQADIENMPVMSDILFRADFFFPPRVPSGFYQARVFLFRNGQLIGSTETEISVDQVGFERTVYTLAHNNPALYGILAIIIALSAGWLAGFVTRKRTKIG